MGTGFRAILFVCGSIGAEYLYARSRKDLMEGPNVFENVRLLRELENNDYIR